MNTEQTHWTRDNWMPSPAILKLQADHDASRPGLGAERAIHYTEFYKSYQEPSAALRKARALADHLARRTIQIHEGEWIVGSHTEHRIGAICHAELAGFAMLEDIFRFETRHTNPLHVDPVAKRKLLLSVMPYWLSRNLAASAFPLFKRLNYFRDQLNAARFIINEAGGVSHFLPHFSDLIAQGTEGLRARIQHRLADSKLTASQQNQLHANLIALEGLETFAQRYRTMAKALGRADIAAVLENAPRRPATNLREALQTIWFFLLVIQIESLDQGVSLGRLDQTLYPLYQAEVARGTFDADAFRELMCAFCLKLSEIIPLFSGRLTEMFAGLPTGQALTIGGIDQQGRDAANELSFLLLDVMDRFKTRQPNWHARVSAASSPAYLRRVFEVIGHGGGSPALYNDDVIIPSLAKRFAAGERVKDYATVGCVEPALPGISFTSSDAAIFNFARILENTLARQRHMLWRRRRAIQSMDDLLVAFETELRLEVAALKDCLDAIEQSNRVHHPVPFASLTVEGCIDSARDLTDGGARFNGSGIQAVGVADLANALAAIEEMVFERRAISLPELANACARNFSRDAELKARLLGLDKFGNDKARVDRYAQLVMQLFDKVISANANTRGGRWMPGIYSMTCHRSMGRKTGALPSGRGQGEGLADGVAPADGSDRLGPTASLNSVTRIDPTCAPNGVNLNIKFDANTLKGAKGAVLLEGLVKGYFQQGGMQVQINVLDPQVLIEARKNPHKHRNLLVRVSGYSAYFADLTPAMQDEIIARTLQAV